MKALVQALSNPSFGDVSCRVLAELGKNPAKARMLVQNGIVTAAKSMMNCENLSNQPTVMSLVLQCMETYTRIPEGRERVTQEGVPPLLAMLTRRYLTNGGLLIQLARVIINLAQDPVCSRELMEAELVQPLLLGMCVDPESEFLQETLCQTLVSLAYLHGRRVSCVALCLELVSFHFIFIFYFFWRDMCP